MNIITVDPSERFSGLDDRGWLVFPNRYHCPFCEYGVYFNYESLTHGAYWDRSSRIQLPKLHGEARHIFEAKVRDSISPDEALFALGFHCPKCSSPVAILFDVNEFAMASYRFRPTSVFEADTPPNNRLHRIANKSGSR